MSLGTFRRAAAASVVLGVVGSFAAAPVYAATPTPSASASDPARWSPIGIAAAGECKFPSENVQGTPWALQRVLLSELWKDGRTGKFVKDAGGHAKGTAVKVAVIDTGVDDRNPQLQGKVENGGSLLTDKQTNQKGEGTTDTVGHGTKVAGIIAAKPVAGTGFVGLAPDATILSIKQNDDQGSGSVQSLIDAINQAVASHADVINISQDVRAEGDTSTFPLKDQLQTAVENADAKGVVIVASSGNDGREADTYPAAFDTVLAVGASDRNNERAPFSEYGLFVDIAAPGVDMLSTVPAGGQCVDNGTSFSAPYVAGVAALLKGAHPDWSAAQIRARIEQTAQRTQRGANKFVGWGIVDPVKAVQSDSGDQQDSVPHEDPKVAIDRVPVVAQPLGLAETQADRDRRTGTFVLGGGVLAVAALAGGSVVLRDHRRRREG
ncbi:type VII secretion-associated serine protease mycosin [Streptomyces sp. TLI_235]|nr:type VII secretion-associated serine protease mycosin [Streptomyces sp. TLI_235]PBC79777.1 type VII secretion-associated serine protease mycosin [Streptomyces sp. TLI_235]